jgi:hypothetical protein
MIGSTDKDISRVGCAWLLRHAHANVKHRPYGCIAPRSKCYSPHCDHVNDVQSALQYDCRPQG